MTYGCCLFSKERLNHEKIIRELSLNEETTLFIDVNDDWAKCEGHTNLIIWYKAFLDDEEEDEYPGYHYYDIDTDDKEIYKKVKTLNSEDIIIDFAD